MKEEINDRILQLINEESLTSQKFAMMLNVQSSNISHITSKRNKPSFDLLYNILTVFPKVSSDWLLMGIGEMYRRETKIVYREMESTEQPKIKDITLFDIAENNNNIIESASDKAINVYERNQMPFFTDKESIYESELLDNDIKEVDMLFNPEEYISEDDTLYNGYNAEKDTDLIDSKDDIYDNTALLSDITIEPKVAEQQPVIPISIAVDNKIEATTLVDVQPNTVIEPKVAEQQPVIPISIAVDNKIEATTLVDVQPNTVIEPKNAEQQPVIPINAQADKKVDKILLLFDNNTYQEFFSKTP